MDEFGPMPLVNLTQSLDFNNDTTTHTEIIKKTYTFMIAFFPLYLVGLFFVILFCLECIYFPIKLNFYNCRYKCNNYFKKNNRPIINNKLNKTYIDLLNKSNKYPDNSVDTLIEDCSICMEDISIKQYKKRTTVVLDCGHHLHTKCLNKWVSQQSSNGNIPNCPICRGYIVRNIDMKEHTVINVSYDSDISTRTTLSDL